MKTLFQRILSTIGLNDAPVPPERRILPPSYQLEVNGNGHLRWKFGVGAYSDWGQPKPTRERAIADAWRHHDGRVAHRREYDFEPVE